MDLRRYLVLVLAGLLLALTSAGVSRAQEAAANGTSLTFGMTVDQASQSLGVPLNYVRGTPGNELFVALPNVRGSILSHRSDGLYLQFGRGHLIGWKGDWGTVRP